MLDVLTDNRNRTVAAIRNLFIRSGGSLGESNSVAWMFSNQGIIRIEAAKRDPEEIELELLDLLDVGADGDIAVDGTSVQVSLAPNLFEEARRQVEEAGYTVEAAEVTMNPGTSITLDAPQARQVLRLLDSLEELDDVQQVYANAEIPDEVLESVTS
jgi:transcriptional/translational regulatory protein YebC/TACO1